VCARRLRVFPSFACDFNNPENNRFLAVSQLWVKGSVRFRRPDVLLYINGIPVVFIELKNSNIKLKNAYEENITNYRAEIPQLFMTNAFCVLTNGIETKVGSFTAEWEYFFNWLRIDDEKEKIDRKRIAEEGTSLERVLRGTSEFTASD
jgi:type I restriction enzyme R subunit